MIFAAGAFAQNTSEKITEERVLEPFSKIDVSSLANVIIVTGQRQKVTVSGDQEMLPYLETNVVGNTLYICYHSGKKKTKIKNNCCEFTIKICVENLTEIRTSGVVEVDFPQKTVLKNLRISNSGVTKTVFDDLEVEGSLTATTSGASHLEINGTTFGDVEISVSGASDTKFSGSTKYLDLTASGASCIKISGHADEVSASASGASNIKAKNFTCDKKSLRSSGAADIYLMD